MLILALDSSARAGSLALVDDDRVIEERAGDPSRSHAERLPREILALLAAHGRALADVELFAVATGPGSFTGLRIGIATMQGFALATGRPIAGVSVLDAVAAVGGHGAPLGTRVGSWVDAHRQEIFSALYEVVGANETGGLRVVDAPAVGDPVATLRRWEEAGTPPATLAGDGVTRFANIAGGSGARLIETPPLAAAIALRARLIADGGGAGHPAAIQPFYVRRPDVEVERDRKRATSWASGTSST